MTDPAPTGKSLADLYAPVDATLSRQAQRWQDLAEQFRLRFGENHVRFFSTPGRTEIGGNHTDHNHGKVLAAAVDLDVIAVAAPSSDGRITVYSEGYHRPFAVDVADFSAVPEERGTTTALIRGIASRFQELGHTVGGMQACITSDVPVGSGLSSSASIEVLLATILNALYNDHRLAPEQIAMIGQYAENVHFGKPCGLMDQIACAVGGIVKIDFEDPTVPRVEKMHFDFGETGYCLLVVDTGGSHADLTEDYASIPREMKSVAAQFNRQVCRQISEQGLLSRLAEFRTRVGDRAILRALHFLQENRRVDCQVEALRKKDMQNFLRLIRESGDSSFRRLQNCYAGHDSREQGVVLALALAEDFVAKWGGACRVHGGGFAGTILVFLPGVHVEGFQNLMASVFGSRCVKILRVRSQGSIEIRGQAAGSPS